MNKKIFQLFFFLIIIVAFGVIIKNYVNSVVSKIEDYRLVLDRVPEGEISRLAPITFHLAQDIDDEKFPLNVPIKNELIKLHPTVKGYSYFTDKRTLEFQPNEPFESGTSYSGKLDVNKLFPDLLLKPYHFKFSTPILTFKIKVNETVYIDSIGNPSPYINGYLISSDYSDYDNKQIPLVASQNKNPLTVSFSPGKNNQSLEFKISGIQRTKKNERVEIQWLEKNNSAKKMDTTSIEIVSKDVFNVVHCDFNYFPTPILTIRFTDIIKKEIPSNSYLTIPNLNDYNVDVNKNEIKIKFNKITGMNHTVMLSKNLLSSNNIKLHNDFKYTFKLSEPEPFIGLVDSSHYIPFGKLPHLMDINVLNLKSFDVEITHVSDKNMMQFLQVNDLSTSMEIERVGKTIFNKTYNLTSEFDYSPNQLKTYNINLLGADLSKSGLYCLTFSYKPNDIIYNRNSDGSNENIASSDEIIVTNVFKHNIIYSNLLAVAKLTSRDSLYIFVSDIISGLPINEANVEIFDFQQNKIASILTNEKGIATIKTAGEKLFVKVQNNADVTYLKLDFKNTLSINNIINTGILPNNGVLCRVEGLNAIYSPSDYLQIAIILKENGRYISKKEHLEVKLESPDHFFFNTEISTINSTDIKLYSTKFPNQYKTGVWKLCISTELADFQYPFQVEDKSKLILPIKFRLDEKKKTLDLVEINNKSLIKNKRITTQIIEYKDSKKKKSSNVIFQTPFTESLPLHEEYKTTFDRNGNSKLNLPNWIKPGMQFLVSSKIEFPDKIILVKDTLLSFQNNDNWIDKDPHWQTNTTLSTEKYTEINQPTPIQIQLDKTEYFSGDSCQIFYSSNKLEKALFTLESGTQIFHTQWVYPSQKKQKISLVITEDMLPGLYASFINYNTLKCSTSSQYISVTDAKNKQQNQVKVDIPKEWWLNKKVPVKIENLNNNDIHYFLSISNNKNTGYESILINEYFNQKQLNTIKNWSSIDYIKPSKKTENTNAYNNLNNFNSPVSISENGSYSIPQILFGPYFLNGESSTTHFLDIPEISGSVKINIIGINIQTGKIIELNQLATIIDPITIKTQFPNYLNPGDIAEIPIEINSRSFEKDTLNIEILNIKELEPIGSTNNFIISNKNTPIHFIAKFQAKKLHGIGEFQISVNSKTIQTTKNISIPILNNPTNLTKTESTQISPQKEWQQIILPIGIKGTNTAILEISYTKIPNIWEMLQNLDENSSNIITNLIDKTFPLIYLNNIIDDAEWENQNSIQINEAILQLSKYQTRNGGFVIQPYHTEPNAWLSSYIGEFMLTASQNGYQINEGILNKWKRYQQMELQRIKYSHKKNESSSAYLIYTLSLANLITINQLNEFKNSTKNNLIDRIYLANSYATLGNDKLAKSVINIDIIGLDINKLDVVECANFLTLADNLKNKELSLKLVAQLNGLIKNKINSSHNIVLAINSILRNLNLNKLHSTVQLKYQINNGKENQYKSTSPLSYINIPLDFTLSKNIDVYNTSDQALFINLSHIGSPQELIETNTKNPDLEITNKYFSLDNSPINTKNSMLNNLYKQVISFKNINTYLNQNLSVSIPIPSGVELLYSNIPKSSGEKTTQTQVIQTQLLLKPLTNYEIVLIFNPTFRGDFISFPIVTRNIDIFNSRTYTQQSNIHVQ